MKKTILAIISVLVSTQAGADQLSGPRLGMSFPDQQAINYLKDHGIDVNSSISQYGWQFERRFFSTKNQVQGITEFVPLLGGFEYNTVLASATWVTGLRLPTGTEFGMGPYLSINGTGIVYALGQTITIGDLNLPLNFSYTNTANGDSVSVTMGFNLKKP